MNARPRLTAIVASYISSEDAAKDLHALDDFYWSAAVDGFDAALLVTDAWSQAHVQARAGRALDDVSLSPVHEAFLALFGGPFIAGKLPAPRPDQRLSEANLRRLGLNLPADAVLIVGIGYVEDPERAGHAFTRADWLQSQTVERLKGRRSDLPSIIADLIRTGTAAQLARGGSGCHPARRARG